MLFRSESVAVLGLDLPCSGLRAGPSRGAPKHPRWYEKADRPSRGATAQASVRTGIAGRGLKPDRSVAGHLVAEMPCSNVSPVSHTSRSPPRRGIPCGSIVSVGPRRGQVPRTASRDRLPGPPPGPPLPDRPPDHPLGTFARLSLCRDSRSVRFSSHPAVGVEAQCPLGRRRG